MRGTIRRRSEHDTLFQMVAERRSLLVFACVPKLLTRSFDDERLRVVTGTGIYEYWYLRGTLRSWNMADDAWPSSWHQRTR